MTVALTIILAKINLDKIAFGKKKEIIRPYLAYMIIHVHVQVCKLVEIMVAYFCPLHAR